MIREEHRSYYAISTTYVYGQEKYLLVSIKYTSDITWITTIFAINTAFPVLKTIIMIIMINNIH